MRTDKSTLPTNLRRASQLLEKVKQGYRAWDEFISLIEPTQQGLQDAGAYAARSRAYRLGTSKPPATKTPLLIKNGQTGISYDGIFGPCLRGATRILIQDPYIDRLQTARNLMEFIETVYRFRHEDDQVELLLVTKEADPTTARQAEYLEHIREFSDPLGIVFSWEIRSSEVVHDRYIETDNGWLITLDRGLDIFKQSGSRDVIDPSNRLQEFRSCRRSSICYLSCAPVAAHTTQERG